MIKKIMIVTLISAINLCADVEDYLVDEIVYTPSIEENVLEYNHKFYETKTGTKIQGMDERHKRIKKIEASINVKVKEFYNLYKQAKNHTKNSDCSMVKQAITMLDGEIKMLISLDKKVNDKQVDIDGLRGMINSLEQDKQNICKGD